MIKTFKILLSLIFLVAGNIEMLAQRPQNPIVYSDVPDVSMIRVGEVYYMSSTTMHMSPGVPIMKSTDLVNWEIVSYCYDTLEDTAALNLESGQNAYGKGTWASCMRYHDSTFYVSTFSSTTGKTYIYKTKNIEGGKWEKISFSPSYHDHTLFFDDDNRIYMIWGAGELSIVELKNDLSGVKEETKRVLIDEASTPAGDDIALRAEGSQLFKIQGKYYLFNICWPRGGMRTVVVHRAENINGPWEGKVVLQDRGIAQGGLVNTPDGEWFSYLFRDMGSVGRIPYMVPVKWENGWPVLGIDGKVPDVLNLPENTGPIPGIVNSDDFSRKNDELELPLVWQWNHNPDNTLWSLRERLGYLRLKTDRVDENIEQARNTLTQRTVGPVCSGSTLIDVSNMKDGDCAGLVLLQKKYGWVGAKYENGEKYIVMVGVNQSFDENSRPTYSTKEFERLPLDQEKVYLKAACDFTNLKDVADFYYSLDGETWMKIGNQLKMEYSLPQHFMGYRFGLFNYSTKTPGGYVDFDWMKIVDEI